MNSDMGNGPFHSLVLSLPGSNVPSRDEAKTRGTFAPARKRSLPGTFVTRSENDREL